MTRPPDAVLTRLERRAARRGPWWIPNYVWRLVDMTEDDDLPMGVQIAAMFAVVLHVFVVLAVVILAVVMVGVSIGPWWAVAVATAIVWRTMRALLRAGEAR